MNGRPGPLLRRVGGWPTRLRPPSPRTARLRHDLEQAVHDGPALRTSALALELGLLAVTVTDPCLRDRVEAVQDTVREVIDDLRAVGEALYPPVLTGAGVEPALRSVAERRDITLDLRGPTEHLDRRARVRTCLLIADHLRTLAPGSAARVRVAVGRRFARVRITSDEPGQARRRHWAVVRCG
ncbi:histidine kinase [Actinokineospora bangkokensis]|uniref:Signal transduction histidine kinase subgroup 3 dimerisation and phosphoacceptor domain-containing protein n=1 Tax=Actinokineospora bangkokensis TaxID=1193682 RepID=A0A1Q9LMV2_9PSEU|nr:histidine kinase [Actinokineospora bangkokensis]OLR93333.1 hypothetical protein BJP25_17835 [Actinokineospora bangkokensis]